MNAIEEVRWSRHKDAGKQSQKSRYVAQRIIRTETARAYADGFVAKLDADDDVVAVRLKLSTRHPVFDICDFFADADMYGLGKGVYPKDKAPPIPLHPHCMCRLEEVFSWELDISKAKNQVKKTGNQWLEGLTDRQRREVLGIEGDKAWKEGESWQKYLRNWRGLAKPETRLKENGERGTMIPFELQRFAKKEIRLNKQEYAQVVSELNTNLTNAERKKKTLSRAIGNYIYTFENKGFDNYRFVEKVPIDKEFAEWIDEDE